MKWSEVPRKFVDWVTTNNIREFERAVKIIHEARPLGPTQPTDSGFLRLISDIREWSPARRRNSEGEYKIELRKHLEVLGYRLNEEFGESKYDLLVGQMYAIEIKKDPDLAEYDRLFGQLARHLEHQFRVIVLIFDGSRGDKSEGFAELVDKYLNLGVNCVEIVYQ